MTRGLAGAALLALAGCAAPQRAPAGWWVEAESSVARVTEAGGVIDIDTPAGLTLWWRAPIAAPVTIAFEAMAVDAGGPNDRVSDLNAFWMAHEADGAPVRPGRSGAFAEYDTLRTYYVGIGGNGNTTTRLRRYVGRAGDRPILPQHDRAAADDPLVANRWTRIVLTADGERIAVERDGREVFVLRDAAPYPRGHFGFRTTASHWRVRGVDLGCVWKGQPPQLLVTPDLIRGTCETPAMSGPLVRSGAHGCRVKPGMTK